MAHCSEEAREAVKKMNETERAYLAGRASQTEYDNARAERDRQASQCRYNLAEHNRRTHDEIVDRHMQNPTSDLGVTDASDQRHVLEDQGIRTREDKDVSWRDLHDSAMRGEGGILNVDPVATGLTNPDDMTIVGGPAGHAVVLTGVVYDENGNATGVLVNDPATGKCGHFIRREQLDPSPPNNEKKMFSLVTPA
jgi:hypothetical protein